MPVRSAVRVMNLASLPKPTSGWMLWISSRSPPGNCRNTCTGVSRECQSCDLLYAGPAPSLEVLATLYREADFDSRQRSTAFASHTYWSHSWPASFPQLPDKQWGCGHWDGRWRVSCENCSRPDFENVAGVEPSTAPIEAAAPSVRPLIRQDTFQGDSFAPESLTLITCFQTIEHLAEPLTFCRDAMADAQTGWRLVPDRS